MLVGNWLVDCIREGGKLEEKVKEVGLDPRFIKTLQKGVHKGIKEVFIAAYRKSTTMQKALDLWALKSL
jgi:hypothetical protein